MSDSPKSQESGPGGLTHLTPEGHVHMVDVGEKSVTRRVARAQARLRGQPQTVAAIQGDALPKGDVLATVRLAAIMGAKRTAELIPLCHPLPINGISVDISLSPETGQVLIEVEVKTTGKTGVEMEALTGASIGALTLYDMCKAIDRGMVVEALQLMHKSGGKSGTWERQS